MLGSSVPVVVVLCMMVDEVPVLFFVGVEEFYWAVLLCTGVEEVVSSVWVELVLCWTVEDDRALDVGWKVVLPSSVNELGVVFEFPYY